MKLPCHVFEYVRAGPLREHNIYTTYEFFVFFLLLLILVFVLGNCTSVTGLLERGLYVLLYGMM